MSRPPSPSKHARESEFFNRIRCAFPDYSREEAIAVAIEACSISTNAAFGLVDEVSRPPYPESVDRAIAQEVLALIESKTVHPLTRPVLQLVRELLEGRPPTVEKAVAMLREIENFPGQYAALAIAYFASDDIDGVADTEYNRIAAKWCSEGRGDVV